MTLHCSDTNILLSPVNNVGSVALLNGVAEGTALNTREGRRITNHSLEIRMTEDGNSTTVYNKLRVMIVYDTSPNGVLPGVVDIIQDTGGTTNIYSPQLYSNMDRFSILSDECFENNPSNTILYDYTTDLELDDLCYTVYNSAPNTIAAINSGALYIACISDQAVAGNEPGIAGTIRLWFYPK